MSCEGADDFSLHGLPLHASTSSVLLDSSYPGIIWRGMDDVYERRLALTYKAYSYAVSLRLA